MLRERNLKTELMFLPQGHKPQRARERSAMLAQFEKCQHGIVVCEAGPDKQPETDLACTQAIEVGVSVIGTEETFKRMKKLHKACEAAGKKGRFITIYNPEEIAHPGLKPTQKIITDATEPYQYARSIYFE